MDPAIPALAASPVLAAPGFLILAVVFVGGGLFATWMMARPAPAFAVGDCLRPDRYYERWENPNHVFVIEEVGERAYRARMWNPSFGGALWSPRGEQTVPFDAVRTYRAGTCPAFDTGSEVNRPRPLW